MNCNYFCDDEECCAAEFRSPSEEHFLSQISAMMYSFGDAKEPLRESVITVASILRRDMNNLLTEAESVARGIRKSEEISHEDLLFLLRRNKGKLKHLMEYLQVFDKRHAEVTRNYDNNEKRKSRDKCIEFLKDLEDCDEYTSALKDETIIDQTRWNVLMKRNWLAKFMDKKEFLQYTEDVLQSSFSVYERISNFKIWLLNDGVIELPLTDLAYTIIRFLARETIAKIVDLALQVQEKRAELQLQQNDVYRYTQIVFDAITEENAITENVTITEKDAITENDAITELLCPPPSSEEMIDTLNNMFDNSNISTNNKKKSDDHLSESSPDVSQSIFSEFRQDSVDDNSNSEFVVADEASSKSYSTQQEDPSSNSLLRRPLSFTDCLNSPIDISKASTSPDAVVQSDVDEMEHKSSSSEVPQNSSSENSSSENSLSENSSLKLNREICSNISDEKDTSSLRINPTFEERFNKRTAITVDDIRQAYMEFNQYPISNAFWDRERQERPKPRLLCTD